MPNWCSNYITINASPESINILMDKLKEATSTNRMNADFGNNWLGNLLLYVGVNDDDVLHGQIRCRGAIENFEKLSDDHLEIRTYSAWSPHIKCIKVFVDHFVNDAKILYFAEEPGCELYWTNDPDIEGTIHIEWYGNISPELEKLCSLCADVNKDFVRKKLSEFLMQDGSFEELAKEVESSVPDDGESYVMFNEYVRVEIEDT